MKFKKILLKSMSGRFAWARCCRCPHRPRVSRRHIPCPGYQLHIPQMAKDTSAIYITSSKWPGILRHAQHGRPGYATLMATPLSEQAV